MVEAINLKKEDLRDWLYQSTYEVAVRYRTIRLTVASVVVKSKTFNLFKLIILGR